MCYRCDDYFQVRNARQRFAALMLRPDVEAGDVASFPTRDLILLALDAGLRLLNPHDRDDMAARLLRLAHLHNGTLPTKQCR